MTDVEEQGCCGEPLMGLESDHLASEPILNPEMRRARDEYMAQDGWVRRFVGAPPRLDETVELYRALGMEVTLDPMKPHELVATCSRCTLALSLFRVVCTRSARALDSNPPPRLDV